MTVTLIETNVPDIVVVEPIDQVKLYVTPCYHLWIHEYMKRPDEDAAVIKMLSIKMLLAVIAVLHQPTCNAHSQFLQCLISQSTNLPQVASQSVNYTTPSALRGR